MALIALIAILCYGSSTVSAKVFAQDPLRCLLPRGRGLVYNRRLHGVHFSCQSGYELLGDRYSMCFNRRWRPPPPICINATGCSHLEHSNSTGLLRFAHSGSEATINCHVGFELSGAQTTYCDGTDWDPPLGHCQPIVSPSAALVGTECNFDEDVCGWTTESTGNFDWVRRNGRNGYGLFPVGPYHDHTSGKLLTGFFLMVYAQEANSDSDVAKLISPLFAPNLSDDACIRFYYYPAAVSSSRLEILMSSPAGDERTLWTIHGLPHSRYGIGWIEQVVRIEPQTAEFQLQFHLYAGAPARSIAIDDVALLKGADCKGLGSSDSWRSTAADTLSGESNPPTEDALSLLNTCAGRCEQPGVVNARLETSCECNQLCLANNNCCYDYLSECDLSADDETTSEPSDADDSTASSNQRTVSTALHLSEARTVPASVAPRDNSTIAELTLTESAAGRPSSPSRTDNEWGWSMLTLSLCLVASMTVAMVLLVWSGRRIVRKWQRSNDTDSCADVRYVISEDDQLDYRARNTK